MSEPETNSPCTHHWVIESPTYPYHTSWGICLRCEEVKEFANSSDADFDPWKAEQLRYNRPIDPQPSRLLY